MSDFLGRVGRHWWLAALSVLAGIAAAQVVTQHQPHVYDSGTSVLVEAVGGHDANVAGGRTKSDINLDTEAQLVSSTPVATGAAKLLQFAGSPDRLAGNVTVEVPANTSVLVITYSATSPKAAQAGSHAFAQAYLQNRQDSATAELTGQMNTVNGKLQELNDALGRINSQLAGMRQDNPNRPNLTSQRETLQAQINTLTSRLNQLSTTTVSPGRIIRDANLPTQPSKPNVPLNLASGATAGLLLSVGLALLRERLDRRVRRAADLTRRADVAVLATVPGTVKPRLDDVFPPFDAGGRVFNRLRNEVLASLPARDSRIVVVTGASRGPIATLVAANLAAAFARTGSETVLISAQLPDSVGDAAPVAGMFDVAATPGLSDVLTGRAGLVDAAQRAPRTPALRVITTGGTASAGGLLQSQSLRDMLAVLRHQAEYVVIEAPSTSSSADAQSLASLADAAIIVVEQRRTTYAQVVDATEQLSRVGTPVLGAVVLARLGRLIPAAAAPAADAPSSATAAGDATPPSPRPQPGRPANGRMIDDQDSPTVVLSRIDPDAEAEMTMVLGVLETASDAARAGAAADSGASTVDDSAEVGGRMTAHNDASAVDPPDAETDTGGRNSITVGESADCARCGNFTVGGNGQLWQLLFAHGLLGTAAYLGFFLYGLWRFRADTSPVGLAAGAAIVSTFASMFWYNALVTPLAFTFCAYALLWRNSQAQEEHR
jgi:Mrp family chromosome partitioning ATPase